MILTQYDQYRLLCLNMSWGKWAGKGRRVSQHISTVNVWQSVLITLQMQGGCTWALTSTGSTWIKHRELEHPTSHKFNKSILFVLCVTSLWSQTCILQICITMMYCTIRRVMHELASFLEWRSAFVCWQTLVLNPSKSLSCHPSGER